jgi:uncharacterized membrane protein
MEESNVQVQRLILAFSKFHWHFLLLLNMLILAAPLSFYLFHCSILTLYVLESIAKIYVFLANLERKRTSNSADK